MESARMPAPDTRVRELRHLKPRMRDDLEVTWDGDAQPPCYVMEDRLRSKYFRVGAPEYAFISLLDGQTSVEEALRVAAETSPGDAVDEHEAAVIVNWLLESELAVPEAGASDEWLAARIHRRRSGAMLRHLNLLFVKIPLVNPDRFLHAVLPVFRWMLGPAFFLAWLAVVGSGLYQVATHWDSFVADTSGVLAVDNWLWLLGVWIALKILHEFFHGLMCKKYGGDVYEAGVILILFAPIGYVDATSSWRFRSRWQRIFTATAGVYIELFVAAIAAWIWVSTEPGIANHLAFSTILLASVNTLVFNANPLMKFDGYHVLSDLVRIPNLYGEGQACMRTLARRWLLGVEVRLPARLWREHVVIGTYGVLSLLWRLLVIATLLIIAATLWHGAGLAVALVSGAVVLGVPAFRFLKYLVLGNALEKPSLLRFAASTCALAAAGYMLAGHITWSRELSAPAVVGYRDARPVHADSSGFISAVSVRTGQYVQRDEMLVRLRNDELPLQIRDMEIELGLLALQHRELVWENNLARAQSVKRSTEVAQQRLADLQYQADRLVLRAPAAGRVVSAIDGRWEGRFVSEGQAVLEIAPDPGRELHVLVPHETAEEFGAWSGRSVVAYIDGRGTRALRGRLERIEPRALQAIRYPALAAIGGGPLPVMLDPARGPDHHVLLEPQFEGVVSLAADVTGGLLAGETGEIVIAGQARPLGLLWADLVRGWVHSLAGRWEQI